LSGWIFYVIYSLRLDLNKKKNDQSYIFGWLKGILYVRYCCSIDPFSDFLVEVILLNSILLSINGLFNVTQEKIKIWISKQKLKPNLTIRRLWERWRWWRVRFLPAFCWGKPKSSPPSPEANKVRYVERCSSVAKTSLIWKRLQSQFKGCLTQ